MKKNSGNRRQPPDPTNGLPANLDAERFVLGSILLDADAHIAAVRAELQPGDFSLRKHQTIYRRILDLAERGEVVDRVTVANELERRNELESCDGLSYLVSLDDGLPQIPHVDGYIPIVKERSTRRRVIFAADALKERAMIDADDTATVIAAASKVFGELERGRAKLNFTYADVPSVWGCESTVRYIIPDLVPEAGITLITGDSGHGKTIFVTAMVGAIISGGEFLGRQAEQRKVIYLDRENPLALVKQHLFDLHIERNPNLIYWGGWCEHAPDGPASVSLMELARAEKPVLAFDSLIAFHPGDEQDASETRRYLQYFRNLAAAGATIILLHHIGKGENARQYRGSTDIKASVDVAWLLEKLGDPAGLLSELRLVPFKNRIGTCDMIPVSFRDGCFVTAHRAESNREIFERIVRTNPNSTGTEIVKLGMAAGLGKSRIEGFLLQGVSEGWLSVRSGKGAAKHFTLCDPPLGEI